MSRLSKPSPGDAPRAGLADTPRGPAAEGRSDAGRPAPDVALAARAVLETVPPSMRAIRQHMRSSRATGLTVPQFRALVFVRRHPATDLSGIAEHLGTSVPAASELVNRLVRQGLVLRSTDERERRRICLTLSDEGTAHLERAERDTTAWLEDALSALTPDRLAALVASLGDLRLLVGTDAEPAHGSARGAASGGTTPGRQG